MPKANQRREIILGVALRKKGWLLIESFLGNEGDPSSYRFALQHDDVPAKYQCLLGHYFAFPSPPYASPTIRTAVLQRIAPEPAALRDQEAALERMRNAIGRDGMPQLDLVSPQQIDVTVRELLANPSFKNCLVELPPTRD